MDDRADRRRPAPVAAAREKERHPMPDAASAFPGVPAAGERRLRAALAARPRALLTDIDGTISAIAPSPEAATLLPGVRALLREACAVFDLVAAISGRGADDALRMVGVEGMRYIGN